MGKKTIASIVVAMLAIWGAWAAQNWLIPVRFVSVWALEERGQWGDTFGALNALFSAFAFSAVLITIWTQQKQINDAQQDQHVKDLMRISFDFCLFCEKCEVNCDSNARRSRTRKR